MDKKDRLDAAKALKRWFDSQEINAEDSLEVMGLAVSATIMCLDDVPGRVDWFKRTLTEACSA